MYLFLFFLLFFGDCSVMNPIGDTSNSKNSKSSKYLVFFLVVLKSVFLQIVGGGMCTNISLSLYLCHKYNHYSIFSLSNI